MRVLVISQWFPPEPRELYLELAQAFQRQGHQVQVVTGFPNWPGGKLYAGYRIKLVRREVLRGIEVVRLPLYPNHSGGLKRALNILSLAVSIFFLGPFVLKKAQHIHVVQIPFQVMAARWLAFWWGARVTMEVQDIWPESFPATGAVTSKRVLDAIEWLCTSAYRLSCRIRVISPGFRTALAAKGVPLDKLVVIPNWVNTEAHRLPEHPEYTGPALPAGFRILYAGSVGLPQGLSVVLVAAQRLTHRPDIQFLIAGDGVERAALQTRSAELGLTNVTFLGKIDQDAMGPLYAEVDAHLVHLVRDPLFEITIPSKIVTCLAYAKPILAGVEGDAKEVLEESGAALFFTPSDGEDLAMAAVELADLSAEKRGDMGDNGRRMAERVFSFEQAVTALQVLVEPAGNH